MQENGAYALNTIGADLRMAGFYGHMATNDLTIPVAIAITNDCGTNWAINFAQALGTDTLSGMSCINSANFLTGSFILVVRGATGIAVLPAALNAGTLYVQSDPSGGILFRGDQYAGLGTPPKRLFLGGTEAPIYPYQARAYYLRPCSRPTGTGGACLASDDGNQPIPTLVRQELAGTTMTEIVSSVQRVSDIIGEITAAASEQSQGIGQVNTAVSHLDQMTQQNAALVEQSAAAAHSMKEQAAALAGVVAVFRTGH